MKHELKKKSYSHEDDAISTKQYVLRQCSKADKDNPIVLYKSPGDDFTVGNTSELRNHPNYNDIFCLGLQTKEQAFVMCKFGGKILCGDATHNMTKYDFQLFTLMVKDHRGKGYPVSHLITRNLDSKILAAYLKELQRRNPTLKIQFAMSDDDKATRKAFKAAFGDDVHVLLCYWHLRRAWRSNLFHITDPDVRENVIQLLEETLITRKVDEFNQLMEQLMQILIKFPKFISYLHTTYLQRIEDWARCHRNFFHDGVDTNMLLESFHNQMKTVYLKRKVNRRVDTLLQFLSQVEVNFWKDFTTASLVLAVDDDSGQVSISHIRGMHILDSDVIQVSFYSLFYDGSHLSQIIILSKYLLTFLPSTDQR